MPQTQYPSRISPCHRQNNRLGGLQGRSGHDCENLLFLLGIELCFHDLQHVAQSVYRLHCLSSLHAPIHNNLRTTLKYRLDFITLVPALSHFHLEIAQANEDVEKNHAFSGRVDSYMIVMTIVSSADSLVCTVTTASCDCMFWGLC